MEWLSSSLSALNGNAFGSIFLVLLLLVLLVGVKKGAISFKGHGLEIGSNDRRLLQAEWDLAKAIVDCIPVEEDDYEHLIVREQLLDKVQQWVVLNNLTTSKAYVKTKQYAVKSIPKIYEILEDPDSFTSILINELVDLKESWK